MKEKKKKKKKKTSVSNGFLCVCVSKTNFFYFFLFPSDVVCGPQQISLLHPFPSSLSLSHTPTHTFTPTSLSHKQTNKQTDKHALALFSHTLTAAFLILLEPWEILLHVDTVDLSAAQPRSFTLRPCYPDKRRRPVSKKVILEARHANLNRQRSGLAGRDRTGHGMTMGQLSSLCAMTLVLGRFVLFFL